MAGQNSTSSGSNPSDQMQFILIQHQSPELVHRFYQQNSMLGRSGAIGEMNMISMLQTINEKILSMDHCGYRAQMKTGDAQESLNGGVVVLVTRYFSGKDNVKRDFALAFFLATQDKVYYVLMIYFGMWKKLISNRRSRA